MWNATETESGNLTQALENIVRVTEKSSPILPAALAQPDSLLSRFSGAWLFVTLWTVACQKLLHLWDFPRKNTGVDCHFHLQGNLSDSRIKLASLISPALAGRFFTTSTATTLIPYLGRHSSEAELRETQELQSPEIKGRDRNWVWDWMSQIQH